MPRLNHFHRRQNRTVIDSLSLSIVFVLCLFMACQGSDGVADSNIDFSVKDESARGLSLTAVDLSGSGTAIGLQNTGGSSWTFDSSGKQTDRLHMLKGWNDKYCFVHLAALEGLEISAEDLHKHRIFLEDGKVIDPSEGLVGLFSMEEQYQQSLKAFQQFLGRSPALEIYEQEGLELEEQCDRDFVKLLQSVKSGAASHATAEEALIALSHIPIGSNLYFFQKEIGRLKSKFGHHPDVLAMEQSVLEVTAKDESFVAPDFWAKGMDGKEVRLSDFAHKNVVLLFWAAHCHYSLEEFAFLESCHRQNGSSSLEFLNVSVDFYEAPWRMAIKNHNLEGIGVHARLEPDERDKVMSQFGVDFYPTILLLSPDRKIIHRNMRSEEILVSLLDYM